MPDLRTTDVALLRLLADGKDWTGRAIAQALWPDSPGHRIRPQRHDGRGGGKGATMPMLGAKRGWRLVRLGLAYQGLAFRQTVFRITPEGREALRRLQEA